jgi:tRNA (cmo5U34)-methyltransferase
LSNKDTNGVYTNDKWEFNEHVADCFEDMIKRSIPQYDVMRSTSANIINDLTYNLKDIFVLDIGCSDGLMISTLLKVLNNRGTYTGCDISEPMLAKARERFRNEIAINKVNIIKCDLRNEFPIDSYYNAVTSILAIQFTPIEYRQSIIQNIYNQLCNSGVFIMVEKVLGNTDIINKLFVKNYYASKKHNGYTDVQIERKRLSLEGVLVPVTNDWNIDLLKQAGFR